MQYKLTDNWNTYVRYDRGFRSGGYNDQVGTSGNLIADDEKAPTNPEFANAIELGSKIEALDSRVRFNTAIFYVKYKDAQRALNSTVTNATGQQFQQTLFFNAANATVKGIEMEVLTRPVAALTFGANYTYQKAKYDKFQANTDFDDTTTCATCDAGQRYRPERVCRSRARRSTRRRCSRPTPGRWPTTHRSCSMAASRTSRRTSTTTRTAGVSTMRSSMRRRCTDAALTYHASEDRWFVKAYGKNLGDKRYRVASQSVALLWTHTQFGEPRAYGLPLG